MCNTQDTPPKMVATRSRMSVMEVSPLTYTPFLIASTCVKNIRMNPTSFIISTKWLLKNLLASSLQVMASMEMHPGDNVPTMDTIAGISNPKWMKTIPMMKKYPIIIMSLAVSKFNFFSKLITFTCYER